MRSELVSCPLEILALIEHFNEHRESYLSPDYKETELRREFLDPLSSTSAGTSTTSKAASPQRGQHLSPPDAALYF